MNYYRLRQVDFDGLSEYSLIVSVEVGQEGSGISLFPNPVSGEARVVFYQSVPEGSSVRVCNARGVPVAVQEVPPGSGEMRVDFSGLPRGLYLLRYETAGRVVQVVKVVRE